MCNLRTNEISWLSKGIRWNTFRLERNNIRSRVTGTETVHLTGETNYGTNKKIYSFVWRFRPKSFRFSLV